MLFVVRIRDIDETALVVLGGLLGERLIIGFTLDILAAADELEGTLDGWIIFGNPVATALSAILRSRLCGLRLLPLYLRRPKDSASPLLN